MTSYVSHLSNLFNFCMEYSRDIAVPRVKIQNDCATKMDVMDERDFAKFEFRRLDVDLAQEDMCAVTKHQHYLNLEIIRKTSPFVESWMLRYITVSCFGSHLFVMAQSNSFEYMPSK